MSEERHENTAKDTSAGERTGCFFILDSTVLNEFISRSMRCPECAEFMMNCNIDSSSKLGFCLNLEFKCKNCTWKEVLKTPREVSSTEEKDRSSASAREEKEINVRMVSFVKSLGRGHGALVKFASHVNTPAPMTRKSYRKLLMQVHAATQEVAEESMIRAAIEVKRQSDDTVDLDLEGH